MREAVSSWCGVADFSRRPLFLAIALCSLGAPVAAQNGAIEEIVVTASPIRDSQAEAIDRQREAVNVVNIIASDTIGRFPDQTAASALARLPAVAVQRDQGQERYIQVRGAPARWTSVAFDGINVVGAEDRIFRFDSVPAAVMDSVEISKTLTPDMPAEALAGRVNIVTDVPLNGSGFASEFDVGGGTLELGEGDQERWSAKLSWAGDRFGVLVAASHYLAEQTTDNNEFSYDASGIPTEFDVRSYKLERETNSSLLKFVYSPSHMHHFSFSSLDTEFLDHELRNQYVFGLEDAIAGTAGVTDGELVGVPLSGSFEDGKYENSTFTNTLAGDHFIADWELNWRINYTETESSTKLPIIRLSQTDPANFHSLSYNRGNRNIPHMQLYTTQSDGSGYSRGDAVSQLNQAAFDSGAMINYHLGDESDSWTYKLDGARDWRMGSVDATFKAGLQIDQREAEAPPSSTGYVPVSALAAGAGMEWNPDRYLTGSSWDTDFNRGFNAHYVDNKGLRNHLYSTLSGLTDAGVVDMADYYPRESAYQVSEDITAAYGMNTWRWSRHELLLGVRMEQVSITSIGHMKTADGLAAIDLDEDYTEIFPSVHWNMDLSDTLKFRAALVSGTARPTFNQLRASATVNDDAATVNGGNPQVKPETARGLDSSLEWYFSDGALLSASAFYRDVDDVLFDSVTIVGDGRYNSDGMDRSGYDYYTTLNGKNGELSGLEISYLHNWDFLPEVLQGFGTQMNVAFLDGEFETPDGRVTGFPGTSDKVMNASVFYENYGWSARLSWQWRDDWLDDISSDAAGDYYWRDTERLDFSLRYQLNDNLGFYLDANNLSDELGVRYQGSTARPVEVEGFGKRFLLGMRAHF
ncbi:TonB-dependent receptor [Gilvimarinus sp. F26214L]|uniref:TonB-dependent receptor n=1 Tax=Gilvimarinus sp. DZF01 TaxID=3461371 RepID=UPI004045F7E6